MSLTIGLTYDLRSDYLAAGFSEEQVAEFDSLETIDHLAAAITSAGCRPVRIGNAQALCAALVAGQRWDIVFNIAEGLHGRSREAQVPAILEAFNVPCTFSDPLVMALTTDKAMAKTVVRAAGLRTPDYRVVEHIEEADDIAMDFPLFAKPIAEGTGKGIDGRSRVDSAQKLQAICADLLDRFRQPVLIEEFLPGREFTVGVLGYGSGARPIGTIEVSILPAAGNSVYSYAAKERCEELVRYSPLRDHGLQMAVEELALKAYGALQCRDAGRIDIKLDSEGRPAFMELNPLPGLHPTHSDLPMIATQEGMSYEALIRAIIDCAVSRYADLSGRMKDTA
jgi:D-alanine-D-alanine ligase